MKPRVTADWMWVIGSLFKLQFKLPVMIVPLHVLLRSGSFMCEPFSAPFKHFVCLIVITCSVRPSILISSRSTVNISVSIRLRTRRCCAILTYKWSVKEKVRRWAWEMLEKTLYRVVNHGEWINKYLPTITIMATHRLTGRCTLYHGKIRLWSQQGRVHRKFVYYTAMHF